MQDSVSGVEDCCAWYLSSSVESSGCKGAAAVGRAHLREELVVGLGRAAANRADRK